MSIGCTSLFRLKISYIIIFSILSATTILSQKTINFQKLKIQDGLSNSNVLSILQDRYGFMWFGTNDGLNMYDGEKIEVFKNDPTLQNSLSNNTILSLFEDSQGNLWISTSSGLNKYDRESDSFEIFKVHPDIDDPATNAVIQAIEDSKGNIYIATVLDGIQKLNKNSGIFIPLVRDSSDASGLDLVLSLYITPNDDISYFHMNTSEGKQDMRVYSQETKEITVIDIPPIKSNPIIGGVRGLGISCGINDKNGEIWLGTADGRLFKFNPQNHSFEGHEIDSGILLMSITEDDFNNFWIASIGEGLIKFNKETGEIHKYKNDPNNQFSFSHDMVFATYCDRTGIIWIGNALGVDRFDPYNTPFLTFAHDPTNNNSLSNDLTRAIISSSFNENILWAGTANGLNKIDNSTKQIFRYFDNSNSTELSNDFRSLAEDKDGNLYIGSRTGGLKYFDQSNNSIKTILTMPEIQPDVRCLALKNESLWIGTSNGLYNYNIISEEIENFPFMDSSYSRAVFKRLGEIREKNVSISKIERVGNNARLERTFSIDKPGYVLVACMVETALSRRNNVDLFDYGWIEKDSSTSIWKVNPNLTMHAGGALKNKIIIDIIFFEPGTFTLKYKSDDTHSNQEWNEAPPINGEYWGIQLYEVSSEEVEFFNNNLSVKVGGNSPPENFITSIIFDNEKELWIGTSNSGVAKYNTEKDEFTMYKADFQKTNSLINNRVTSIFQDKNNLIWITTQGGLSSFDKISALFSNYTEEDGFSTNILTSIITDHEGNYWISSLNGISMFNPPSNGKPITIINYGINDGLPGNEYFSQSSAVTKDGQIFIGGRNGIISYYPETSNPYPPEIIIKGFYLYNDLVKPALKGSPLKSAIYTTDMITLDHTQNMISFEFQAIHFSRPSKNVYSYKLEGIDDEWVTGPRNYASYTNLDPGEYKFVVKAASSDGVWNNEGKSLSIIITSPWWATTWAYILYGISFVVGFVSFNQLQKRRILKREREKSIIEEAKLRAAAAEAQSRAIQAENDRKTRELEEARELQLSMLPKELPDLPNLDIAVYMKTATEVGGDYYDFHIGMDGTLTAAIGDATGHGLNAGTIVTATKSLFNTHAANPDILFTFSEISRVLKNLQLRLLSMCLSIIKIKQNKVTISSAGMPPVLIYRDQTKEIEEFLIKGFPLGVKDDFPYTIRDTEIAPGDTILMMSDGFPELFNRNKEMLGYDKVKDIFAEVYDQSPEEIITHLKNVGSDWLEDKAPDDDITFVVINAKK